MDRATNLAVCESGSKSRRSDAVIPQGLDEAQKSGHRPCATLDKMREAVWTLIIWTVNSLKDV